MNHLTNSQIQKFADGTGDYLSQSTLTKHLAVCVACRNEVEMQKAIMRSAKRASSPVVSRSFTKRVMKVVHPTKFDAMKKWVADNVASMAAMTGVLAVISWVLLTDEKSEMNPIFSELKKISVDMSPLEQSWGVASGFVGSVLTSIPVPEGFAGTIAMSAAVLLTLYAVDRVVGRRAFPGKGGRAR